MTAAEVEETLLPPVPIGEAVVATVTKIKPHPHADRLRLVTVRIGKTAHTVVCGAPNVRLDQRVPFLAAGCHYQGEHGLAELSTATIRGVESKGMLASARDLGFGNNHDGIMVLPNDTAEGTTVAAAVGWEQPTIDLEITPNRGDLLSYIGLAREVGAIEKTRVTLPPIHSLPSHTGRTPAGVTVETALCSRYTATLITGINNGPSPLWMQARLLSHDINPQNAIVDITNYVMLELGQPLHAFDAATIRADNELRLTIRTATPNELLVGLDGNEYRLTKDDIIIDANGGAVALAGVIGGSDSAVSAKTTEIVLESAVFDPVAVRKTATRHSCRTDAVTRFEKGIDPEMTVVAVKRVIQLCKDICGGEVSGAMADANYQRPMKQQINVSLERARRVLGVAFNPTQAKSLLTKIGFGVSLNSKHELSVLVPSWRLDVEQEEDIFEELIRLGGYDQIKPTLPSGPLCTSVRPTAYLSLKQIRLWLVKNGLRELESPAFASAQQLTTYFTAAEKPVGIANPTTKNEAYYRFSLLPNMVERIFTQSRTESTLRSFEIGNVATHHKGRITETTNLAVAILTSDPIQTVQQLKGIVTSVPTAAKHRGTITFHEAKKPWPFVKPHPEEIRWGGKVIGQLGVISSALIKQGKVRGERYVVVAELTLNPIFSTPTKLLNYCEPHKYPVVERDITINVHTAIRVRALIDVAESSKPPIVRQIDVVNYHQTDHGPHITFRLSLYDNRTLTDTEITAAVDQVTNSFNTSQ